MRIENDRTAEHARIVVEPDADRRSKARQADRGIELALKLATDLREQYKFKDADAALALVVELARSDVPERLPEIEQARRDVALRGDTGRHSLPQVDLDRGGGRKRSI